MAARGAQRGVARLLNTAGGRVLCLAGDIDGLDARSVTGLSPPALALAHDHLDAAETAGRPVTLRLSAPAERLLAPRRHGPSTAPQGL